MADSKRSSEPAAAKEAAREKPRPRGEAPPAREVGGPKGPEPTRYGDWEHNGRCSDF
jgi:hypothetical protein